MNKKLLLVLFAILILVAALLAANKFLGNPAGRTRNLPEAVQNSQEDTDNTGDNPKLAVLAKNLEIPWSMVFLPSGEILFTERPGRVRIVNKDGKLNADPVATITAVKHIGEGGLLGIELDPEFKDNQQVYLYYTYGESGGNTLNRVERYKFDGKSLKAERIIVDGIPGASNHDGGRIKFGPDKFLYITTGDAQEPSRAQDTNSLAGKILRVTKDGQAAPGNPFSNRTYSYGHRNPQGITWDTQGRFFATEHGRSGAQSGLDELNLIEPGKNYGWAEIQGNETREGMVTPLLNSGSLTWAPSGAVFFEGSIYFTGLRGVSLFEYDIESKKLTRHLNAELGRIRDVVAGPDNMLYIATSNRDGRGVAGPDDDRIVRISPSKL